MRRGFSLPAILLLVLCCARAEALDVAFSGYLDARLIAPTDQQSWIKGGLGKFRFGGRSGDARLAEAFGQADVSVMDDFSITASARLEPTDSSGLDLMEAYFLYAPKLDDDFFLSVKTGAFYPGISLENDDIGWTSPYTLTPSAINSWIGEEIRTLGSEANLRWNMRGFGTLVATGALVCCNDEAGILIAERGWGMDDRPTGLFERVRMPDATGNVFHRPNPFRSGMFDEIDNRLGWYAGLTWQLPDGLGKLSMTRYDNRGDPEAVSLRDTAWETKFWAFGARTNIGGVLLIAQHLAGYTAVESRGTEFPTKFQSAFLLASYDWDDFRFSARGDVFQTQFLMGAPSIFSEDGNAFTGAISYTGFENFRLTAEVVTLDNRRGEYALDGFPVQMNSTQGQFSVRWLFN